MAIKQEANRLKMKYQTTDPYDICTSMDIQVIKRPMGASAQSCKGFFLVSSRCKLIVINSDLPESIQRIIIAHELGHAVLHSDSAISAFHEFAMFDYTDRMEYEQYRAGRISREKFADIQKTDSEKLARLSSRAEEIKRLLVEHYESRGNLAAGKRTADQIILLKDYDPEIIRNFVERVRVYPSGEIEIDMRTSSGFEFVTAS